MHTQKVIFITGSSRGFGLEITKAALDEGDKVIATVRDKPEQLKEKLKNHPDLLVLSMDVTNEDRVIEAVSQGIRHFGRIDTLINNAGYGIITAIEEASDVEVKKQYATNVFGLLNVVRAVLPYMRAERSGHIINISSLFAYGTYPGWSLYGSTKSAVEGISRGLAVELAPLGIYVTSVEPGIFRTGFLSAESYALSENVIDDYLEIVGPSKELGTTLHGRQPGDPEKLARVILDLVHLPIPPLQLPIGKDAVKMITDGIDATRAIIDEWYSVSTSTDFDEAPQPEKAK
ncbi:MAG: SDR family NAD(P)-dependent oxidoreductase [Chitinophagaceae bacterium]